MGNTFEVYEYLKDKTKGEPYQYHLEWSGESFLKALWIMWKLKREGAGCVKLEWRG